MNDEKIQKIDKQIKELNQQIIYWQMQEFVTAPNDRDMLKTTITSMEYVIYNLNKIKEKLNAGT